MSRCCYSSFTMPAADLGRLNPLPDIKNVSYIHAQIEVTDAVPNELKTYINKGMIPSMLPYCQQDGYNRERQEKSFNCVILENKYLKATFLPELGGRLWSLIDKTENRELLYKNPVFQPCNLALRNAWFSGGVEFNVSIKGHNPLTCDPLFSQKITMPDGCEGIRMFEYERIRGVLYSIDAWLPDDSKFLFIRPRIENRTGKEIWMYWWSNIAVPYYEHTRVISPAEKTFINYFGNDHYVLDYSDFPNTLNTDVSYPENLKRSLDFFYHISDDDKKWIAAVDKNGYGLLQCSTPELKGRKLFVWGEGAGGKNWNNYLSDGQNDGYIEIQAGLARTQLEHIPMMPDAVFSWVEAYGAVDIGTAAHGEFSVSKSAVEEYCAKNVSDKLDGEGHKKATAGEFFSHGNGWGALEQYRRKFNNEIPLSDEITIPDTAMADAQREWITLLEKGYLPERDEAAEPLGYVVDEFWHDLLENGVKEEKNRNWYALMHLGVMKYAKGEVENALRLFKESAEKKPSAWCYRNIAMIYKNEMGDTDTAYAYMKKAVSLNNTCRGIVLDTAVTYLAAQRYEEWLEVFDTLGDLKSDGRLQLYCAKALMALGRYHDATKLLNANLVMPDIKEGDTAISDVWFTLYGEIISQETGITDPDELKRLVEEKYPLGQLDFRTH